MLIAAHPQISFSHAVLAGLAEAGGMFIACNQKRMPCAMLLPLETHSTQTERFQAQASLPLPNRKRLWQQIVKAKIQAQARLLQERTEQDWGLEMLAATRPLRRPAKRGSPRRAHLLEKPFRRKRLPAQP